MVPDIANKIPHAEPLGVYYSLHHPLQTENERDLSLAGIYTASRRVNLNIEIISDLIFINRNNAALGRNNPIDVFGGSPDAVADIVHEIERNPDALQMLVTLNEFNY